MAREQVLRQRVAIITGAGRGIGRAIATAFAHEGAKVVFAARPNFSAYAASKTVVVRLTETLAEEVREYNVQVNAIAPGAVNTRMLAETLEAGAAAGEKAMADAERQLETGGTPPELAAALAVFLASEASGSLTGKLIAAPYDPWREWAGRGDELNATPMYTIRRLDPFTIKPLIKDLA